MHRAILLLELSLKLSAAASTVGFHKKLLCGFQGANMMLQGQGDNLVEGGLEVGMGVLEGALQVQFVVQQLLQGLCQVAHQLLRLSLICAHDLLRLTLRARSMPFPHQSDS